MTNKIASFTFDIRELGKWDKKKNSGIDYKIYRTSPNGILLHINLKTYHFSYWDNQGSSKIFNAIFSKHFQSSCDGANYANEANDDAIILQ